MRLRAWLLSTVFILAVLLPCKLHAQAVGSIVGVVSDRSEALVPNATVTAVQNGTNFTRTVASSTTDLLHCRCCPWAPTPYLPRRKALKNLPLR